MSDHQQDNLNVEQPIMEPLRILSSNSMRQYLEDLVNKQSFHDYFTEYETPDFEAIYKACRLFRANPPGNKEEYLACRHLLFVVLQKVLESNIGMPDEEIWQLDSDEVELLSLSFEKSEALNWLATGLFCDDVVDVLLKAMDAPVEQKVQNFALSKIVEQDSSDDETLKQRQHEILKTFSLKSENERLQIHALLLLCQYFSDDPETLPALKTYSITDINGYHNNSVTCAMAERYHQDQKLLLWLIEQIKSHENISVRNHCVDALDNDWPDKQPLLDFISNHLVHDEYWYFRKKSIDFLVKYFPDEQTAHWFVLKSVTDIDNSVRKCAVAAIRKIALQAFARFKLMTFVVDHDDDIFVQEDAMRVIMENESNNTETAFWLKRCAEKNPHNVTRCLAIQQIVQHQSRSDRLHLWLRNRFIKDEDRFVKEEIIKRLARDFRQHTETLKWLEQIAADDSDKDLQHIAKAEIYCGWMNN